MMEFVNGKDDIPYMENNPFMLETTNQINIDPEHHQFWVETNLNQPLSCRVYVNLLKGIYF